LAGLDKELWANWRRAASWKVDDLHANHRLQRAPARGRRWAGPSIRIDVGIERAARRPWPWPAHEHRPAAASCRHASWESGACSASWLPSPAVGTGCTY